MKKQSIIGAILSIALFFTISSCNKDEISLKITGTVSISSTEMADGAVVTLSTSPNAVDVVAKVIADAEGKYTIPVIASGNYYLSAKYNSANTNNMKSSGFVFMTASDVKIDISKDDVSQDLSLVSNAASGTALIKLSEWALDETHSTIAFEFPYDAENGTFVGIFGAFDLDSFVFDEANPENSYFSATVETTSAETGASSEYGGHGRDGVNGCIASTLGVEFKADSTLTAADTNDYGQHTTDAVINNSNKSTFVSTSVEAYGDGYLAKGNLTLNSLSSPVELFFHYIEGYDNVDNAKTYCSFEGFFLIKAQADHEIESHHVGDSDVTIRTIIQLNKDL